jgi:hypothetical protein
MLEVETALAPCIVIAVLVKIFSLARSRWVPSAYPNKPTDQPMPTTLANPSGLNRDLLKDQEFLEELNQRWQLMAAAYRTFVDGWNSYVRDLGNPSIAGRPGMRQIATDRFNSIHDAFVKRVKQFAAAFDGGPTSKATASIEPLVILNPRNTKDMPFVQFTTMNNPAREINLNGKPITLRFVAPIEQTVRETDLPCDVPIGRGN